MTSNFPDIEAFFLEARSKVCPYLKGLSNDLYEIYAKEKNADFDVYSSDNQKYRCHKAILAARSPIFAVAIDVIQKTGDEYITLDIGKEILRVLLEYIYSGDLSYIVFREVPILNMYNAAHMYGLSEMKDFLALQILPNKQSRSIKLHFPWKLKNIEASGIFYKSYWKYLQPKSIDIGPDKFHITAEAIALSENNRYLVVCLRRETERDIVHKVSLDVTILDNSMRKNFFRRLDYIFKRDGECGLPQFVKLELIEAKKHIFLTGDCLIFNFTLEISFYDCEDEAQENIKKSKIINAVECSKVFVRAYQKLSNDFLRLFLCGKYSNLLFCAAGGKLTAHKCIIMARTATGIHVVRKVIAKLSLEEAKSFLLYLYSGDSKYLKEHAQSVHRIVSRLKLYRIKFFYSYYLSRTLTIDNVMDRLVHSNSYLDDNLMQNAFNFINLHAGSRVFREIGHVPGQQFRFGY